jgi:hypothetical protein
MKADDTLFTLYKLDRTIKGELLWRKRSIVPSEAQSKKSGVMLRVKVLTNVNLSIWEISCSNHRKWRLFSFVFCDLKIVTNPFSMIRPELIQMIHQPLEGTIECH